MKSVDFIRAMQRAKMPVFSTAQAAVVMSKSTAYASLFLARLRRTGEIKQIEKGKYYAVASNAYAVASNVVHPSYISMLSAFRYHGITTQNVVTIDIVSSRRHAPIAELEGYAVRFTRLEAARIYGFYRDRESSAFVAYIEKALVDSLHMESVPFAYVKEAAETAKATGRLDMERLHFYVHKMGSKAVEKRAKRLYKYIGKDEPVA